MTPRPPIGIRLRAFVDRKPSPALCQRPKRPLSNIYRGSTSFPTLPALARLTALSRSLYEAACLRGRLDGPLPLRVRAFQPAGAWKPFGAPVHVARVPSSSTLGTVGGYSPCLGKLGKAHATCLLSNCLPVPVAAWPQDSGQRERCAEMKQKSCQPDPALPCPALPTALCLNSLSFYGEAPSACPFLRSAPRKPSLHS